MKKLFLFLLFLLLLMPMSLFAASGDWTSPASYSGGTNWNNPGNIYATDDQRADYPGTVGDNLFSQTHSIGAGAEVTIDSLIVRIEGYGASSLAPRRKITLVFTKDGSSEIGDAIIITLPEATESGYQEVRGVTDDLWGTTWTVAEVNASTFGVSIDKDASKADAIYIDHVQASVWWTEAGAATPLGRRRKIIMINK